jgi:DNA helicase-2/ATP-dependent DNA helicase PcrA
VIVDEAQQLAANSTQSNLLVVAPPGCGKTELLALRAQALIPRLRPHQRILALTFTNRARDNLAERLRRLLGPERARRYVTIRNFHGHAAEIILAHGATIGLDRTTLAMPTTNTFKQAVRGYTTDRNAQDAAAEILSRIKREPLSDDDVLARLAGPGLELARRVEVDRVAAGQLHYDDLLRHAQRLLRVDAVANLYQQHYGAVLVDEFQDMSLQQLDVALRSCNGFRTFVGDPLQGIYSWAGAAPVAVEARLREVCGEPQHLTVSYRSSPAVLGMVNALSADMRGAPLLAHDPSAWQDGGAAAAFVVQFRQKEAEFIRSVCKRILTSDPSTSIGVIARSGWRRRDIDRAFSEDPDLPYRRWDLSIDEPSILERLRTATRGLPKNVTIAEARDRIVASIDPSDVDTIEDVEDVFDALEAGEVTGFRAALNQIRTRSDDSSGAVGPGAHLLNAHTGKGQQFDWVFAPGIEDGHIPDFRSTSPEQVAEERRVLLVMLSRARHGAVITRSQTSQRRSGVFEQARSRWWDQLATTTTMDANQLEQHILRMYPLIHGPVMIA